MCNTSARFLEPRAQLLLPRIKLAGISDPIVLLHTKLRWFFSRETREGFEQVDRAGQLVLENLHLNEHEIDEGREVWNSIENKQAVFQVFQRTERRPKLWGFLREVGWETNMRTSSPGIIKGRTGGAWRSSAYVLMQQEYKQHVPW